MRKFMGGAAIALAVSLSACCVFNGARHPEPRLTLAQHLDRKTVAIDHWMGVTGVDEDGDQVVDEVDPEKDKKAELNTYCTGVWINKDTIITAAHCTMVHKPAIYQMLEEMGISATRSGLPPWSPVGDTLTYSAFGEIRDEQLRKIRTSHKCKVIAVDEEHDVAVLKAESSDLEPLPEHEIATLATDVRAGDEMHIVGHPSGMLWTYVRGPVAAVRNNFVGAHDHIMDVVHVSAPIWFGNSGGGAFNENGELVGIMSFLTRSVPNSGFFIKFNHVADILDRVNIKH